MNNLEESKAQKYLREAFGEKIAQRIYESASPEALEDLVHGEKAFDLTFLQFLKETRSPGICEGYFRLYDRQFAGSSYLNLRNAERKVAEESKAD